MRCAKCVHLEEYSRKFRLLDCSKGRGGEALTSRTKRTTFNGQFYSDTAQLFYTREREGGGRETPSRFSIIIRGAQFDERATGEAVIIFIAYRTTTLTKRRVRAVCPPTMCPMCPRISIARISRRICAALLTEESRVLVTDTCADSTQ